MQGDFDLPQKSFNIYNQEQFGLASAKIKLL